MTAPVGFFLCPATAHGVGWWVNTSASSFAFSALPVLIRALMGAVGAWGGRGVLGTALTLLLHRRLSGICGKMERLALRFQAGRLWAGRTGPRGARAVAAEAMGAADAGAGGRPARIWPCRFGWLVRLASYQAAGYGARLRAVLGEPEMVALLAAAPQAARILRPMCRALGVETSVLRPRPEAVRPEEQLTDTAPGAAVDGVRKRVRAPRAALDLGRIPLPRGVLAAGRRQGFGKRR